MSKKKTSTFLILADALGLYGSNIKEFMQYMSFPVLGQLLGLVLIFTPIYFLNINLPSLMNKYSEFNNVESLLTISLLVTLPGLLIMLKAVWEYIVSYGAINSMFANMQKSGRVYDFKAHTELIKRRTFSFVCLWGLLGIFTILALCPLLWIIAGILGVYLSLVFQVFTFESELSPFGCLKKSFNLVKGHFAFAIGLLTLSFLLTYIVLPQLFVRFFDYLGVSSFISIKMVLPLINQFNIPNLTQYGINFLSNDKIAYQITVLLVTQFLVMYTLPVRSIACSLLYKHLNNDFVPTNMKNDVSTRTTKKTKSKSKIKTSNKKRPSEILMENSHKKFATKKLDRNLMRRALEKDDD